MEKQYAQAIFDLAQKEGASASDILKHLTKHLEETGRQKLLPRIGRELARLQARHVSLEEELEVASSKDSAAAAKEALEFGITTKPVVNESLISGWRARKGSRIIDRSGKRALIDLYAQITAHT